MDKDLYLTKLRPLFVAQILLNNTDEDHLITIAEIMRHLHDEYGIDSYRATIKTDIEMLQAAGMDIEFIKSSQNQYHILSRDFDIAELKILIDAVESSKFISKDKSKKLVDKISRLAGPFSSDKLKRNIDVERRVKADNEQVFYIVDAINEAINSGKQICFQYFEYNVKKERKLRHNGYWYKLSPYRLVWNGDHYYVVGYCEKHKDIASYRVDRMACVPDILEDDLRSYPKNFDLDKHLNSMFHMYSTERKEVTLICRNDTIDYIIDTFGEDVEVLAYDMENYRIDVEVAINKNFFTWVLGFDGKVKIKAPEDVKEQYKQMVLKAAQML